MPYLPTRKRAIFSRRQGSLRVLRLMLIAASLAGIGGAGFAAGLRVGMNEGARSPAGITGQTHVAHADIDP